MNRTLAKMEQLAQKLGTATSARVCSDLWVTTANVSLTKVIQILKTKQNKLQKNVAAIFARFLYGVSVYLRARLHEN